MFTRISLSGCGWKVFWYYGVIQKLAEHRLVNLDRVEWITASAGGGAAIHFLSGLDGYEGFKRAINVANMARMDKAHRTVTIAVNQLEKEAPDDIHTTGRLVICYTRVSLWPFYMKYEMVDEFLTRRDLFESLRASTSIPLMNDILRFKNRHLHVDAGIMCNQPARHHGTLRISAWPLSFGSDIKPQPSALFDNYTIQIPEEDVAEKMFNEGLKDGEKFALKYKSQR
jgi:hypothetical protein